MNAITLNDDVTLDEPSLVSNPDDPSAQSFTLRRTGRKAVRFHGHQLVEAVGIGSDDQVTHDLNLYSTTTGRFVVELIVRRGLPDQRDLSRIHKFDDLVSAATWLENYRAGNDVRIPAGLECGEATLPWAVLQAVQLRQTMERIETNYRCMLSEVFMALDLTDPAELVPTTEASATCPRNF